jgi:hypothetical protein
METATFNPETARAADGNVWGHARREYLSGVTAAAICQRYGMSMASFRAHARAGGWRRIDRDECGVPPEPAEYHRDDDVSFADLADEAFLNIRRAMGARRAAEASSWMRLYDKLADRARAEVLSDLPDYPAPEPDPVPDSAPASPAEPLYLTQGEPSEISPESSSLGDGPDARDAILDSLDSVFSESSPGPDPELPAPGSIEHAAIENGAVEDVQRKALILLRSRRLELGLGVADIDAQLADLGPASGSGP